MLSRILSAAMALAVAHYALPVAPAWAGGGEAANRAEEEEYAQREIQARGLEEFVGGNGVGLAVGILVAITVVILFVCLDVEAKFKRPLFKI